MSKLFVDEIKGNTGTTVTVPTGQTLIQSSVPAFSAGYAAGAVVSGDLVFDTANVNNGSHYSTTTGRFTAPVSGLYFFAWSFLPESVNSRSGSFYFKVNGTQTPASQNLYYAQGDQSDVRWNTSWTQVLSLTASQYVTCYAGAACYRPNQSFSGFLIG